MRIKICLHGIEIKDQNQLLNLVCNLLPECLSKCEVIEKYLENDDKFEYQETRFEPKFLGGIGVNCAYGFMTVCDRSLPIADVTIDFENDNSAAVEFANAFIDKLLLSNNGFTIVEPCIELRIAMMRGRYYLDALELYNSEKAASLVYTHLPWQVYEINRLWQELLSNESDRILVRQLRVKVRRLRSVISLLGPLFNEEQLEAWQGVWKSSFDGLAAMRELDVALITCERITKIDDGKEEKGVPLLEKILEEKKNIIVHSYLHKLKLNAITKQHVEFLLWLYESEQSSNFAEYSIKDFLEMRFAKWSKKLLVLREKYPDSTDIVSLHKIRIKLKRFRYALQSVPEMQRPTELLRALKNQQDSLGLLHDGYVDETILEDILNEYPGNKELHYEVALFRGWDKGKSSSALENFPIMWENFCSLLRKWQLDNL